MWCLKFLKCFHMLWIWIFTKTLLSRSICFYLTSEGNEAHKVVATELLSKPEEQPVFRPGSPSLKPSPVRQTRGPNSWMTIFTLEVRWAQSYSGLAQTQEWLAEALSFHRPLAIHSHHLLTQALLSSGFFFATSCTHVLFVLWGHQFGRDKGLICVFSHDNSLHIRSPEQITI